MATYKVYPSSAKLDGKFNAVLAANELNVFWASEYSKANLVYSNMPTNAKLQGIKIVIDLQNVAIYWQNIITTRVAKIWVDVVGCGLNTTKKIEVTSTTDKLEITLTASEVQIFLANFNANLTLTLLPNISTSLAQSTASYDRQACDFSFNILPLTESVSYIEFTTLDFATTPTYPINNQEIIRFVDNTFTWGALYTDTTAVTQSSASIEWKDGESGTVTSVNVSGNAKQYTFSKGYLPKTNNLMWRVKVIDNYGAESPFSSWVVANSLGDAPIITSLEPNNIAQNKESQILVSWENQYVDEFTLYVKQNNTTVKTYTGTTQKQILLSANSLNVGTCTLELICKKLDYNLIVTKTATFEIYGKPNIPVLDLSVLFNTSLPVYTWNYTGTEQISYNLEIRTLENVLIEQVTQLGANKSYTTINNLTNNTDYIIKLRIKNSWNLWSDYATKQIRIQFTEMSKPNILVYGEGNTAIIEMTAPDVSTFSHNSVYRKTDKSDWIRIANNLLPIDSVTDYTIADGIKYYYKIRSVGTGGQLADSDIVSISTRVQDYILTDVTNSTNQLLINSNPHSNFNKVKNTAYSVFAGCSKPTVEVGIENYITGKLSFFIERAEYDLCMDVLSKNTILSYRDYMGRQIFGFVVGEIQENYEEYIEAYNISFEFVEVDFDMTDMLFSNGLKPSINVIYLDGRYKLDGTIKLTGVVQQ